MNNETTQTAEELAAQAAAQAAAIAEAARIKAINDKIDELKVEKTNLEIEIDKYKIFIGNIGILRESINNTIFKNDNTYSIINESISVESINSSIEEIFKYSVSLKQWDSNLFTALEIVNSNCSLKEERCDEIDLEIQNLQAQL